MDSIDETCKNSLVQAIRALSAARHVKDDNVPCEIVEGLFLGSIGAAYNKEALKSHNITHVLTVAKSLEPAYPSEFTYKKIEVLDSPGVNLRCHFEDCFDFIDQAKKSGGNVLVHCFAGMSRSVTIVLAYLMKYHFMSLPQALELVRKKRPQIAPNYGFMTQLEDFDPSKSLIRNN